MFYIMISSEMGEYSGKSLKIWPGLGLAAIHSNCGGGYRVYSYAKTLGLDIGGRGYVYRAELQNHLRDLGINSRLIRRWISEAINSGLLVPGKYSTYHLVSLGKAALLLDCKHIGQPAIVNQNDLIKKNWRAIVWGGILSTMQRPVSQKTKRQITGIPERSQRYYQAQIPKDSLVVIKNIVKTNLPVDHLVGLREAGRSSAFTYHDRVYYRLPDIITTNVAKAWNRGRSKKIQKFINSFLAERVQENSRIFFNSDRGIQNALRNCDGDEDIHEIFKLVNTINVNFNIWSPITVGIKAI